MSRKKVIGGILVVALVLVAVGRFFVSDKEELPSVELRDGSTLAMASVSYGTNHVLSDPPAWQRNLRARLPAPLQRFMPATSTVSHTSTNPTAVAWLTRRDAAGNTAKQFVGAVKIFDEHGCLLVSSIPIRKAGGRLVGHAVLLPFIPAAQKHFRMEVYEGDDKLLATFEPRNPFPDLPTAKWQPLPLPQTVTNGEFAFTLTAIRHQTNATGGYFLPEIAITRAGRPALDWSGRDSTWTDVHGNQSRYGGSGLCRREPVWKLKANLFRSVKAVFPADEIWSVTNVALPAPGMAAVLGGTNVLQDVALSPLILAGPGICTYSNGVFLSAQKLGPGSPAKLFELSVTQSGTLEQATTTSDNTHLALRTKGWTIDQRVSVRLVDQAGRAHEMLRHSNTSDVTFFSVALPKDVTHVTVEIMAQKGVPAEFFVVPPGRDGK